MICWQPREDRREFSQGSCGSTDKDVLGNVSDGTGRCNPAIGVSRMEVSAEIRRGKPGVSAQSEVKSSPAGIHYASRTCTHSVDCNLRCDDCDEEFDLYWSDPDAWGDGGIS